MWALVAVVVFVIGFALAIAALIVEHRACQKPPRMVGQGITVIPRNPNAGVVTVRSERRSTIADNGGVAGCATRRPTRDGPDYRWRPCHARLIFDNLNPSTT